jgi:hypothetical protein
MSDDLLRQFEDECDAYNHQEVENILEVREKRKKKVNSGNKGDRTERNLCKLLIARFGRPFERVVGSGNRWGQVKEMTQAMKDVLVGDIATPEGFLWTLECKGGYEREIDFHSLFLKGNRKLDEFLVQVSNDADKRSKKKPMLLYKRNLRQWLAFVRTKDLPKKPKFTYKMVYGDWTCVAFETLLEAPDTYFFT